MKENILICGIGAVGSIYAEKIQKYSPDNLKILVDEQRLERYTKNPPVFNGKELCLNYILPDNTDFRADIIIIATKFDGLPDAVRNIKNFVGKNTIILSLLNGVTSEEIIAREYGWDKLLLSYFIGHSAMRDGRFITHDGVGKIVFGAKGSDKTNEKRMQNFFDKLNIDYEIPNDIEHALWLKFMMNVSTNQPSAILRMTFGEMNANEYFMDFAKKLIPLIKKGDEKEILKLKEKYADDKDFIKASQIIMQNINYYLDEMPALLLYIIKDEPETLSLKELKGYRALGADFSPLKKHINPNNKELLEALGIQL